MKKLKLELLQVKSFKISSKGHLYGGHDEPTGLVSCAGGFTCVNTPGCAGVYTFYTPDGNACPSKPPN